MAHWSFILLHTLMQHMQQRQSAMLLQQPLPFWSITSFSARFMSPNPVIRFSLVASLLPNPSFRPWSGIRCSSLAFCPFSFCLTCSSIESSARSLFTLNYLFIIIGANGPATANSHELIIASIYEKTHFYS